MEKEKEDERSVTIDFILSLFLAQFDATVKFLNFDEKMTKEKLEDFIIYCVQQRRGSQKNDSSN
jgi:hypothetical protein